MSKKPSDMTRSLDLTHEKRIGAAQRMRRPIYVDLLPPCNHACPAGENIQAWLAAAQAGKFKKAWQKLIEDNPLPAVHGRVCYHPCEGSCNRAQLDETVSIHAVERFLGDRANRKGWKVEGVAAPSGKRVLVVGAGPSGLSAAYHLTRLGHQVEVHDAGPVAGGMMHFGIPAYRLPRADLDADIRRIEEMGVRIVLNHKVEDLLAEKEQGGFDAAFVAVGAHLSKRIDIPARDAGKMLDAVSFLHEVETGAVPKLGRRVAIYGGGNTAMDAARVAKRLGADEALIIYRRDREHMPAHAFEAADAEEEGIHFHFLCAPIAFISDGRSNVAAMELIRMQLGEPDASGRRRPIPIDGSEFVLDVDMVIPAIGQMPDLGFMVQGDLGVTRWGTLAVDPDTLATGLPGVFAGATP